MFRLIPFSIRYGSASFLRGRRIRLRWLSLSLLQNLSETDFASSFPTSAIDPTACQIPLAHGNVERGKVDEISRAEIHLGRR